MKTSPLITVFLVTCTTAVTVGMELNRAASLSVEKCKKIDQKNDQKMYNFLQEACEVGLNSAEQIIENKISYLEKKLTKKQNDLLLADKKKFGMDDELWQKGIKWGEQLDSFEKTAQPVVFNTIVHSATLPALFIALLKKEMVIHGLNPNMFNIREVTKTEGVSSRGYGVSFCWGEDDIKNMKIDEPGFINIPREIIKQFSFSYQMTEAFCADLIVPIVVKKTHPFTFFTTNDKTDEEVKKCTRSNSDTIKSSVLLYALKNQRIAELLKTFNQKCFCSPNAIISQEKLDDSIQYYEELCKINRYHKILAWLKEYADISRRY